MYRKFTSVLEKWEESKTREPLLIIGARQVGKTWIIREFCDRVYGDYVYLNLEQDPDFISVFEGSSDPERILFNLEQLLGRVIDESTPIFIDEIQQSEQAITSLKYFCESEKNYRIIGAGSLLGVKINRFESSFPVGKVVIKQLFPMDFEEFLIACGEEKLAKGIRKSYEEKKKPVTAVHNKAIDLYRDYLFVGGMPRVVEEYLTVEKHIARVDRDLHRNLHMAYMADMTRYTTSPAEGVKITEVYNSIPRQLAKTNPKFKYNEVRPGANRRDFTLPIDWLAASGLILRIEALDSPRSPLKGYVKKGSDRIYYSDTGILTSACGLSPHDLFPDVDNIYKGAVVENYCMQQFQALGMELYFFKPSESMEIDLVCELGGEIVPVEIKSGRNKRSTSLKNYMEKYTPSTAIRISEREMGWSDGLISLPLYAIFCLG